MIWEELSNTNFKLAESREFKIDSATQSFTMSPSRWIKETNARRDYANILQLVILVNLENLNAQIIKDGLKQKDRLEKLNNIAEEQYAILYNSNNIKKIEILEDKNHFRKLEQ